MLYGKLSSGLVSFTEWKLISSLDEGQKARVVHQEELVS